MGKHISLPAIGLLVTLCLLTAGQLVAQPQPDRRFGMTEVFWLPEEARDLGVGWERILFYWREIQPTGPDDWNTLHVREEWLTEAASAGREVVGLIKNTAPWASEDGTEAGLPKGLYLPLDDPHNYWANYVRRLADYYSRHGVHHWIIWNEPEIEQGVYGFEFAGTEADYYQMLKIAYKVMKDRDPAATIHLAGLTWWHDPTFLDRLLAIAAADPEHDEYEYFFDVISLHVYFRTETVKTIIDDVNEIQGKYGLAKPIWINETNAPPNQDPEWPVERPRFNIDLEQQAWFIVQAMALGFASGAERISVYKMLDIRLPEGGESFGVLRPDQSKRPAYDAFKMTTSCLDAFNEVIMESSPLAYRITFSRPGTRTHVAWSRTTTEATVRIPAITEKATVVRLSETESEIEAENGVYSLQLGGQRCDGECLVGGEPQLLIEATGDDDYARDCVHFAVTDVPAFDLEPADEAIDAKPIVGDPQATRESAFEENAGFEAIAPVESVPSIDSRTETTPSPQPTVGSGHNVIANATMASEDNEEDRADDRGSVPIGDAHHAMVQERDSGTIGLWVLGLALVIGLITLYIYRRTKTDNNR